MTRRDLIYTNAHGQLGSARAVSLISLKLLMLVRRFAAPGAVLSLGCYDRYRARAQPAQPERVSDWKNWIKGGAAPAKSVHSLGKGAAPDTAKAGKRKMIPVSTHAANKKVK